MESLPGTIGVLFPVQLFNEQIRDLGTLGPGLPDHKVCSVLYTNVVLYN